MAKQTNWTGGGADASWSTPANWDNGVPGAGDTATIVQGTAQLNAVSLSAGSVLRLGSGYGNATATLTVNASGLTVGQGATLDVLATAREADLTLLGTTTLAGATLVGPASYDPAHVPASQVFFHVGGGASAGRFVNTGSLTVSGGQVLQLGAHAGTDVLENDGTITVQHEGQLNAYGAALSGTGQVVLSDYGLVLVDRVAQGTFSFADGTGQVAELTRGGLANAVFRGFRAGDSIALTMTGTSAVSAAYDAGTCLTTLTVAATGETVRLAGDYTAAAFTVTDEGNGMFSDLTTTAVACYAEGTRVATPRGEVAIEALREGDAVLTVGDPARPSAPVVWVGWRDVDALSHPRPEEAWPVRIAAGALGPGRPARELRVSPDHAVLVSLDRGAEALVPARLLLDGAAVAQEPVDAVRYFHLELPEHDLLLAEGTAAESWLDTGNRERFGNAAARFAPRPDGTTAAPPGSARPCRPLVTDGPLLAEARRRIAARTAPAPVPTDPDPDLCVQAGGRLLRPMAVGGVRRVMLPAGCAEVLLLCRVGVPASLRLGADDRRLGVALDRLAWDTEAGEVPVALDDPALDGTGFHEAEHDGPRCWRWTRGRVRLRPPPGARGLTLGICGQLPAYPVPTAAAAA